MEQLFQPIVIVSIFAVLLCFMALLFWLVQSLKKSVEKQFSNFASAMNHCEKSLQSFAHQLEEERAKSLVMAKQISHYQNALETLGNKQRELEQQDPSTRLYQKAVQLAKDGASVDDLVQACDLPKAEAQLLVNLHKS